MTTTATAEKINFLVRVRLFGTEVVREYVTATDAGEATAIAAARNPGYKSIASVSIPKVR